MAIKKSSYSRVFVKIARWLMGLSLVVGAAAASATVDESFRRWDLSRVRINLFCLSDDRCQSSEQDLLKRLADDFDRLPSFLRGTPVWRLTWHELPKGKPTEGTADDRMWRIAIQSDRSAAIDEILAHEITHLYAYRNPQTETEFLKIRYRTPDFYKTLRVFFDRIAQLKAKGQSDRDIRAALNVTASDIKLPQRFPNDFHAVRDEEYFAVCVELYFRHQKRQTLGELAQVLTAEEMNFLADLFKR